jgi:hypothetical protein
MLPRLFPGYRQFMRRPALLAVTAFSLCILSLLITGCGGGADSNKPGPVKSWGKDGVVRLDDFEIAQTLEDSSGRVLAVGLYGDRFAQVVRLRPDGSLDPSFGKSGVARWPYRMFVGRFGRHFLGWDMVAVLPGGRIALAGTNNFGDIDEQSTLVVSEIDEHGQIVRSFGQNGYFTTKMSSYLRGPTGIATQGDRIVVSVSRFRDLFKTPEKIVLMRLTAKGTLDASFGRNGVVQASDAAPYAEHNNSLLALSQGRLALAASTPRGGRVLIVGLLENGDPDRHFGRKGTASTRVVTDSESIRHLDALLRDRKGNLSLTGSTDTGAFLVRFNRTGRPINFWTGSPWVPWLKGFANFESFGGAFGGNAPNFGQLPQGELAVAGAVLAHIGWYGNLDASYQPQPLLSTGKFRNRGLLVAHDGTVLVTLLDAHHNSGVFTAYIARYR